MSYGIIGGSEMAIPHALNDRVHMPELSCQSCMAKLSTTNTRFYALYPDRFHD
jgi:hypothetical protein